MYSATATTPPRSKAFRWLNEAVEEERCGDRPKGLDADRRCELSPSTGDSSNGSYFAVELLILRMIEGKLEVVQNSSKVSDSGPDQDPRCRASTTFSCDCSAASYSACEILCWQATESRKHGEGDIGVVVGRCHASIHFSNSNICRHKTAKRHAASIFLDFVY